MSRVVNYRLLVRLTLLTVLTICLVIILRRNSDARLTPDIIPGVPIQTPTPLTEVKIQPGTPLVISVPTILSVDAESPEITFKLTNVFQETIRAFVIGQNVEAGDKRVRTISIHNLDLNNSELLPNQSIMNYDTYEILSPLQHRITLSVDYVEFANGSHWGSDSNKSSETIRAQRAGARALSKRLNEILDVNNDPADVMQAIERGNANIVPPSPRSDASKEDFQNGCDAIIAHLKRLRSRGGLYEVSRELRKLSERLKEAN